MRVAALLTIILGVATCAVPAADGPAIPNPGMEDGAEGPEHWQWSTGENGLGEFTWEAEQTHGGQHSFHVRKLGSGGYTDLCSDTIAVQPGRTYRISAWVYAARNVPRGVYFMVNQIPAGSATEQLPNTFGDTALPLHAGEWQQVTVDVAVRPGNDRVRIHCIQAFVPSDVLWDDFEITEPALEPPPRYEPPTKEPLPDLEHARAVVRARARASAQVETRGGRPRLSVDGKPVPWAFYVSPFWNPGDAQIADFRDAGVRVYLVPLVLGRGVYGDRGPWLGPDRYDFGEVDDLLWRVLRVDPEGHILFYMACDPYREWGADNPDDVTQDQDGRRAIVDMHPRRWGDDPGEGERFGPSSLSPKFRSDVANALRALVRHVEESEPGKAVIGYHVAGLNDGQWFHWDRLAEDDLHLADYSPGAIEGFREWLRETYGSVEGLRAAWHQPGVTLDSASAPAFGRYWVADRFLLDPATEQDCIDWTRFLSEGVAETVDRLAGVLKAESKRPIVCGTYYEDITCNSGSHIALGKHLASSSLGYLAGPAAYSIRMPGYPGAVRSVSGSTLLHGKTYLTEQDWRSWHSVPDQPDENFAWGRAETAEQHNAMVRRECGMMLAFGLGTWWYDMGGGWFHDEGIMSAIAEARRAFERDLDIAGAPAADLAVFVSEEGSHALAPPIASSFRWQAIVEQVPQLNTCGVPYLMYLLSDLARADLPVHKAYLFLNAYALDAAQRRAIEGLKRDGHVLVFVHAPGVIGAADPTATISDVTGIAVKPAEGLTTMLPEPRDGEHPLLRDLDGWLGAAPFFRAPAWAVTDPVATPLATFAGTDLVAVAARDFGTWKAVYVGSPCLSSRFLHNLAEWAGCWVAAEPGDAVYANDRILTIHAIFTGRKALHLARPAHVADLTSGEAVAGGDRVTSFEIGMTRGETRWFALD